MYQDISQYLELCIKAVKNMILGSHNILEKDFSYITNKENGESRYPIGIIKIGSIAKAAFLNHPIPEQFTSHCFRRISTRFIIADVN